MYELDMSYNFDQALKYIGTPTGDFHLGALMGMRVAQGIMDNIENDILAGRISEIFKIPQFDLQVFTTENKGD